MNPLLSTPRLLLREFIPEDAEAMFKLNSDPEVLRYTGDEPFVDVAAAEAFLRGYNPYATEGYGRWAVLLKETGETLGWCGLRHQPDLGLTDLGYRFHKRHWGKGFATESGRACLDYGFGPLALNTIVARAAVANTASIRVMEKLGMRFWKEDVFEGEPAVLYRVEREGYGGAGRV